MARMAPTPPYTGHPRHLRLNIEINFPRSGNLRRYSDRKAETNFGMNDEGAGMPSAMIRLSSHSVRRRRNLRSNPDRTGTLQNREMGGMASPSIPIHFPSGPQHRMRSGRRDERPHALDSIYKNQSSRAAARDGHFPTDTGARNRRAFQKQRDGTAPR